MREIFVKTSSFICMAFIASGCSVPQLEARLEANPQCRDVVNPKTGALMPCPGSDKAFYRELGLIPAKASPVITGSDSVALATLDANSTAKSIQIDCKPQIHKKTGGTMPCPTPE